MGVTITVALAIWFASSLVEYKIVSNIPPLKVLFHGLPGVVISLAIGAVVARALGAPAGVGVMLGQLLGVATNTFTFKMWTGIVDINAKRKDVQSQLSTFKSEHPQVFSNAVDTIKLGIKTLVGIVLFVMYVLGLPAKIYMALRDGYKRLRYN